MPEIFDVLIIGAGPSGMLAATAAGERGLKTVILEKKSRPAIKLSITGKGRCNLTNSANVNEFVSCFRNGKFLYGSFNSFSNNDLISFFENLGVPCKLERGGRYFPVSDEAQEIVDALVKQVKKISKIITSVSVKSVLKRKDGFFDVNTNAGVFVSKNVIVACGGLSYPSTGSTGDGYKIAESFGHKIKELSAALVPLVLECPYLKELNGLKLKNVEVSVLNTQKVLAKEFGEAEFTIFGADGPTVLTLSSLVGEEIKKTDLFLSVNFKPALTAEQLDSRLLRELDKYGQLSIKDMLKEMLPVQAIKPFIDYCGFNITKKCSQISRAEREKIISSLFDFRFKIKGVRDIKEAIVTRGGISVDEIEQKTMQSKLVKGLYFCGEIIDVDAPTGGFNLQAAFSTGYLAGNSVKKSED
ncbi:MAG: NAD(P)/FAD-dependent oxidoreductase [Endomicrobia bacterium]|nr:NAD(P)/FAD-dependent oxidoreductase [Endomicrobiia bacterium]MCL2506472.1 NAD(P)/FAD-dependent oxidoreductase [Endomicrobiia bacterium]